jgi:hypothetical protein
LEDVRDQRLKKNSALQVVSKVHTLVQDAQNLNVASVSTAKENNMLVAGMAKQVCPDLIPCSTQDGTIAHLIKDNGEGPQIDIPLCKVPCCLSVSTYVLDVSTRKWRDC